MPWRRMILMLWAGLFVTVAAQPPRDPQPILHWHPVVAWAHPDHVQQIVHGLTRLGADSSRAKPVAVAIYRQAPKVKLDPFLVAAVVSVENPDLLPRARSSAGAIGIMQVMPSWKPVFRRACGDSLTKIGTNICMGVHVLSVHLDDARGSIRRALLSYSGCVSSPGCEQYSDIVLARYHKIKPRKR